MNPKLPGTLLLFLVLTVTITVSITPTLAAPAPAPGAVPNTAANVNDLPEASAQRRDRDYDYDGARAAAGLSLIVTLVILLSCAIGPIVALLICFCPQIFPCKKFRNRSPGCGRCDWSDMTTYGYYRNRNWFGRQPAPVIVQVSMPAQQQYAGQNVPLMPPPVVIQQPSPMMGGRYQPGVVYSVQHQQSVYTSPSYPVPVHEAKQQSYNPNFPS